MDTLKVKQVIDQIEALTVDSGLDKKDSDYLINYLKTRSMDVGTPRDMMQIRRGEKQYLPNLAHGELGWTTDTKELYIGNPDGNVNVVGDALDIVYQLQIEMRELKQYVTNLNIDGGTFTDEIVVVYDGNVDDGMLLDGNVSDGLNIDGGNY